MKAEALLRCAVNEIPLFHHPQFASRYHFNVGEVLLQKGDIFLQGNVFGSHLMVDLLEGHHFLRHPIIIDESSVPKCDQGAHQQNK